MDSEGEMLIVTDMEEHLQMDVSIQLCPEAIYSTIEKNLFQNMRVSMSSS